MNTRHIAAIIAPHLAAAATLAATAGCASTYSNLEPEHLSLVAPATAALEESPEDADVAVRRHRTIEADAGCLYDIVADIPRWTAWDQSIESAHYVEGERAVVGTVFFQDVGGFHAQARILEAKRGEVLRWRGQNPDGSGPVGVHTWTFVPQAGGKTLVINDEHFHSWYLRPMGWFTDLGISDQFDTTLADLEKEAQRRCK